MKTRKPNRKQLPKSQSSSPRRTSTSLSASEQQTLAACENILECHLASFLQVGTALASISRERLYRQMHPNFEDYCRKRWQFSRIQAFRLIKSAHLVKDVLGAVSNVPMPRTERQVRALIGLPPALAREAWQLAVKAAKNSSPTGKSVARIVRDLHPGRAKSRQRESWETLLAPVVKQIVVALAKRDRDQIETLLYRACNLVRVGQSPSASPQPNHPSFDTPHAFQSNSETEQNSPSLYQ